MDEAFDSYQILFRFSSNSSPGPHSIVAGRSWNVCSRENKMSQEEDAKTRKEKKKEWNGKKMEKSRRRILEWVVDSSACSTHSHQKFNLTTISFYPYINQMIRPPPRFLLIFFIVTRFSGFFSLLTFLEIISSFIHFAWATATNNSKNENLVIVYLVIESMEINQHEKYF